ncbi:hypothetical protein QYF36_009560 [Acer negundo]|nr:hypothetical protein QYF36_009560 [Acer negundo]
MEGVGNHKEKVTAHGPVPSSDTNNGDIGSSGLKNDTYGPWMHVSYGRNGKLSTSTNFGGKKASVMGSIGKVSSDTRYGSGPPVNGADVSWKGVDNRKEIVKPYVAKNGRKVGNHIKEGNNNMRGSRFAVLSKEVMEGFTGKKGLHIPKKHTLVPTTLVLVETFNKDGNMNKLGPSTANKYLVTTSTNKSHHYVSSNENRGGGHTSECIKGSNKGKQVNVELDENLEDSEVLKLLHKDMMDTIIIATISPSTSIDGCNSSSNVSAVKDLEVVALNLSETMEVALE